MKKIEIFILWDTDDGYKTDRVYLDKESAEIALSEHYTEHWIIAGHAKIEQKPAVSYAK